MLQISAFTNGTFVSPLDVQSAIFENEVRGSALWLDVYRPRDNEILLFNRHLHQLPPTENSFLFSLSSFKALKRLIITRNDATKPRSSTVIADATVLFADDLIVSVRNRGFRFAELIEYIMRNGNGKMPTNVVGLYDAIPPTYFAAFAPDLSSGGKVEMFSEHTERYQEDIAYFPDQSWTLREMTIPIGALLSKSDGESLVMTVTAVASPEERASGSWRIPTAAAAPAKVEDMIRGTARAMPTPSTGKKTATLVCTRGPEAGNIYRLDKPSYRIGRDAANDIPLNANGVSRRHAMVSTEGDKVFITDLGSTNGTYVNGKKIQQQLLKPGDEIFVGNAVFKLELR
ncbi:MAG: FHA domain-containing protein [Candidatus Brocadiia bacterium]